MFKPVRVLLLTRFYARVVAACLAGAVALSTSQVGAVGLTFTLNQSQSNLSLDIKNAQLFGLNLSLSEQATGSLKSSYTGTIATDINGSSIDFPGVARLTRAS